MSSDTSWIFISSHANYFTIAQNHRGTHLKLHKSITTKAKISLNRFTWHRSRECLPLVRLTTLLGLLKHPGRQTRSVLIAQPTLALRALPTTLLCWRYSRQEAVRITDKTTISASSLITGSAGDRDLVTSSANAVNARLCHIAGRFMSYCVTEWKYVWWSGGCLALVRTHTWGASYIGGMIQHV